jgi:Tol biopolymer transport system component
VAALNHPNICQIFDVGPDYLVMEYIEGQPLQGPLPLDRVLDYAAQICDALDAAHRKGIVHRDLKPGNIMVTKTGIKLLDFGLAKMAPVVAGAEQTATAALTGQGVILGTLQYMSPEQLQGLEADARSDIFAFGLVLYEMLTGKRAFEGGSPASLIGAILERPSPSVAGMAPAALDRVLRRCLAKDRDDRWQSARDVKAAMEFIVDHDPSGGVRARGRERSRWLFGAGWIAALLATLFALFLWRSRAPEAGGLVRFAVYPPDGAMFTGSSNTTVSLPQFAVSPDGRTIIFAAALAGAKPKLWLRSIDDVVAQPLAGTEGAIRPFWSPDGRWVAFFTEGELKRIPSAGGHTQVITRVVDPRGATWGGSDTILFGTGKDVIYRVPAAGGATSPVTALDRSQLETAHRWPHFLPDGAHFLFTVRGARPGHRGIYSGSLDGTTKSFLKEAVSGASYSAPGYLLWVDGNSLLAQPFDARRGELRGQLFIVSAGAGLATTSEAGISVAASAEASPILRPGRLTWFDRSGKLLGTLGPDGDYTDFRLSPDNKSMAASLVDPKSSNPNIWLTDLARGSTARFTLGNDFNAAAVWSPDGARLVFRTTRSGVVEFFQKSASLGGSDEVVLSKERLQESGVLAVNALPTDWSKDGQQLIFSVTGTSDNELWLLQNPGRSSESARPVKFMDRAAHANFSPDGRHVAYTSNESGTYQVYVQTLPLSDRKWLVSTGGGYEPRWRGDGREIYYLSEDRKLMAVPVGAGPTFGVPKPLFQTRVHSDVDSFRTHYDASWDGQRFLVHTRIEAAPNPIIVVLNWTTALKK